METARSCTVKFDYSLCALPTPHALIAVKRLKCLFRVPRCRQRSQIWGKRVHRRGRGVQAGKKIVRF